jgi:hypothetical protein
MNERIRDLAVKADVWCDQNHAGDDHYDLMWEQKFAELIVQECVASIEKTIETNCDTGSEKMGCEFAITDLLEHFGVPE